METPVERDILPTLLVEFVVVCAVAVVAAVMMMSPMMMVMMLVLHLHCLSFVERIERPVVAQER